MLVSITEGAKLVRKHRQTLYNHNEKGKLTLTVLGDGTKAVETAELERVYGKLYVDPDKIKLTDNSTEEPLDSALQTEIDRLVSIVESKDELLLEVRESRDFLREECKSWKEQADTASRLLEQTSTKLLEHQAKPKRKKFFGVF